jgi:hypothetical protein
LHSISIRELVWAVDSLKLDQRVLVLFDEAVKLCESLDVITLPSFFRLFSSDILEVYAFLIYPPLEVGAGKPCCLSESLELRDILLNNRERLLVVVEDELA